MNLTKKIKRKYLFFKVGIILSLLSVFFYNFDNETYFYSQTGFSFIFFVIGFIFSKFCDDIDNINWSKKITLFINILSKYFLITLNLKTFHLKLLQQYTLKFY